MEEPPLHWIHRAMDIVYRHRVDMENALFEQHGERDLFNQTMDIVFYDTTTLSYESRRTDLGSKRQFGYSKEHKSDCVRVVPGLPIDKDGIPVGYELFPGNTYDGKSVPAILEKLKIRYRLGRVVFVADRGMIGRDNIEEIEGAGLEFILGMRLWKAGVKREDDFYNLSGYRVLGKRCKLLIRETEYEGRRLIPTWSSARAEKDARTREQLLAQIEKKLAGNAKPKQLVSNRGYRQFVKGLDEGRPEIDAAAVEASRKRDGFFGVLTNVPREKMTAEEVYSGYKNLWRIEDAFGELKGPLQTRPMFHWTDKRIEAHVLICLLAYYVEAMITKTLREKKADFTVGALFRALNEVYATPVTACGTRAWVRNELHGTAAKGYQYLNLKPPDRVLKLEKTSVVPQISVP